jgi:hypothetical protein
MALPPRLKERIVDLTSLYDNLALHLEELPHTARHHAALAALLERARELESRHDRTLGELIKIRQERADLDKESRELRNLLAALLRGAFGEESSELAKFGIKPRPHDIRRKRLTRHERAERLAGQAARLRAELEDRQARREAAEAPRRARIAKLSTR